MSSKKSANKQQNNTQNRFPVIAVLGHVDHGKSSLLDYIRKSNVVDGEAGGITQRISAYEVTLPSHNSRTLTFLDTPGHAAFSNMREKGVLIADIAILVVSAEDGVKEQTKDAWTVINDRKIPYVVAINKIDKPGADIQKTKNSLVEAGIYIEGYGGDVPCVEISAKTGQGVDFLLETLAIIADMENISTTTDSHATGFVLESFVDKKRGISATLVIKDGKFPSSGAVLTGISASPIRIVENFAGKPTKNPTAGQAVLVTGFDTIPVAGATFITSEDKKMIEGLQNDALSNSKRSILDTRAYRDARVVIPVVIKADSAGTLDAVVNELKKRETADVKIKVINKAVGDISENDIMQASHDDKVVVIGFGVKAENNAVLQADRFGMEIHTFDIIYKLTEWFDEVFEDRLPYEEIENITGTLKVLKTFSVNKDIRVVGGAVTSGVISFGGVVKISRRGVMLGKGTIVELQSQKIKAKEVQEGNECGISLDTKVEVVPGDTLEQITIIKKKI